MSLASGWGRPLSAEVQARLGLPPGCSPLLQSALTLPSAGEDGARNCKGRGWRCSSYYSAILLTVGSQDWSRGFISPQRPAQILGCPLRTPRALPRA